MSNQEPTPNNTTTGAKTPTRTEFLSNIREADISTIPADDRNCMICWGKYGETDEINDTSEDPVKLSCPHWIGSKCFHNMINKKKEPDYKFNNRCPKCRRELFESEVDPRLFTLRDDILRVRTVLTYLTWEDREALLTRESITSMLGDFDAIVNMGAEIGDVYDQEHEESREEFNGSMVAGWWDCMMESHIVYYLESMPGPIASALRRLIEHHNLYSYDEEMGILTNAYVEDRIEINNEQTTAAYSLVYNLFDQPSSHSEIIHHSMMPSHLFLRVLVLLQSQLAGSQLTGDEWNLLKLDKGDESQRAYKKLCLLTALEIANHATHNQSVELLQEKEEEEEEQEE